jgi:hypothetical protein
MRALLLVLLLARTAGATAPGFVQSKSTSDCGVASLTVTLDSTATAGNCMVVLAGSVCLVGLPLVSSVTDTSGSTYSQRVAQTNVFEDAEFWTTSATGLGAAMQVTVNFDATCADSPVFLAVAEYSAVGSISGTTTTNTGIGDPVTITHNNQVGNSRLVAGAIPGGGCTLSAPSDNGRELIGLLNCVTVDGAMGLQDAAVAATGNKTFTWTLSGACGWPALVVELDPLPTPTATATDTVTATATSTATRTTTATASGTDTASATATRTATATVTATATKTPTRTPSPIEWTVCLNQTPVMIATIWPYRSNLSAGNPSPDVDVFYGDFQVTSSSGQLLPHGQVQFWSIPRGGQLEWWACAASPTVCIRLLSVDE